MEMVSFETLNLSFDDAMTKSIVLITSFKYIHHIHMQMYHKLIANENTTETTKHYPMVFFRYTIKNIVSATISIIIIVLVIFLVNQITF